MLMIPDMYFQELIFEIQWIIWIFRKHNVGYKVKNWPRRCIFMLNMDFNLSINTYIKNVYNTHPSRALKLPIGEQTSLCKSAKDLVLLN